MWRFLQDNIKTNITGSTANTRMRDFYDFHILYQLQSESIDLIVLKEALIGTGKKRGTVMVKLFCNTKYGFLSQISRLERC